MFFWYPTGKMMFILPNWFRFLCLLCFVVAVRVQTLQYTRIFRHCSAQVYSGSILLSNDNFHCDNVFIWKCTCILRLEMLWCYENSSEFRNFEPWMRWDVNHQPTNVFENRMLGFLTVERVYISGSMILLLNLQILHKYSQHLLFFSYCRHLSKAFCWFTPFTFADIWRERAMFYVVSRIWFRGSFCPWLWRTCRR